MLAEAGIRLGRYVAAEKLLLRCLELAPSFSGARHNYALVLYRQNRAAEAIPHMERLVAEDPHDPAYRILMAAILASTGSYDRALDFYADLVARQPRDPRLWLSYGHALRTAGRSAEAVAAYRNCLDLPLPMGEAWWSLANLKTGALDAADRSRLTVLLQDPTLGAEDSYHLNYALGRALEDAGEYAASWTYYARGAEQRRAEVSYDAETTTAQIDFTIDLFSPEYLAAGREHGCPDGSAIFVVGLPRSGSTLIEQMLASHPLVEGTMELPEMANLARELAVSTPYPQCLADLSPDALAGLGQRYLERSRSYRRTDRPFFIDKMPNNWLHAGLIHLILPNAKIIDARRHPMATCFSAFKQHFARGQHYTYNLTELGRFYRDYVRLMEHFDNVLPGRIHRVQYERMVDDTETELRRLLTYCGLDFDPACLRFHENRRAVRTASSEQVRQPIFRSGLDQWRHYEPWLEPLRLALAGK
jgi:tetratricopeptide (TPR) repeat protein